jgi:hypothetical protein
MATKLDSSHPLTYDWLNTLVTDLEKLNNQSQYATDNVKIKLFPNHLTGVASGGSVQMVTGNVSVTIPKGKATGASTLQKFKPAFSGSTLMVIPTINFVGTDTEVDAFCWVTNISETGCIIKVRRLDKVNNNSATKITINYLAIGKPTS